MLAPRAVRIVQLFLAGFAVVFGIVTVFAGARVLTGTDPGYPVFRPLLVYNTIMGVAYLVAGVTVWRSVDVGRHAAAVVFLLNLLVFVGILVVHRSGGSVAVDSLRAMALRTALWLGIFLATSWIVRIRPAG